jgi:hypothetical protein
MESTETTLLNYTPFPRNSVNLIVGPTHIGKTFFVTKLLNNYKQFFIGPVERILIVLCNDRVQPLTFDSKLDVHVEQIPLSEYVPDILLPHDLVVIDDLQTETSAIQHTISVSAHHYNLVALFVITHNLLGNPNFELVRRCHRLFLFMNATTNTSQAIYFINHFYQDPEIKKYLKTVVAFCEREKEILALELNRLASQAKHLQVILAFSHLGQLVDKGFFYLYPYPHWGNKYSLDIGNTVAMDIDEDHNQPSSFPDPTLVAVPVSAIVRTKRPNAEKKEAICSERKQWEETIREIEENIESYFPPPRWQKVKNLAKEILRNPDFCVKTDGKTFHLKDRPRTVVSMIDFLAVATRRAGPMERDRDPIWKNYGMHVETLLRNNAPKDLFKNKLLMPKKFQ